MAMEYVKGADGILSVHEGSSYKPVVCLTNTSLSQSLETQERITYCTKGEPEILGTKNNATLAADGYVMLGADDGQAYNDVLALYEGKEKLNWKLEGRGGDLYFEGLITDISDSYPAEDDATFNFTIQVQGEILDSDPNEQ